MHFLGSIEFELFKSRNKSWIFLEFSWFFIEIIAEKIKFKNRFKQKNVLISLSYVKIIRKREREKKKQIRDWGNTN